MRTRQHIKARGDAGIGKKMFAKIKAKVFKFY